MPFCKYCGKELEEGAVCGCSDALREALAKSTLDEEADGSVTCYVAELELVENAPSKKECLAKIIKPILRTREDEEIAKYTTHALRGVTWIDAKQNQEP